MYDVNAQQTRCVVQVCSCSHSAGYELVNALNSQPLDAVTCFICSSDVSLVE